MKHLGDITLINGGEAPTVDCVIGGSPCQDLSIAGKRAGLDGEKSGLFMEQIRIVKEMRKKDESYGRTGNDIRPRYMVWENVSGAFSSSKGEDFRIVLEEIAKVKDENAVIPRPTDGKWKTSGCIVGGGWSIAWRVLDAQFWGVPQRRRRIALVADFGGQSAPEILFVRKSVSGYPDESEPKRQKAPTDASGGIGADDSLGADQYNAVILGDKVSTLGVNCGMSHGRQCVLEPYREGTVFSLNWQAAAGAGLCVENEVVNPLACTRTPAICYRIGSCDSDHIPCMVYSIENHPNDSRVKIDEEGKVQALTSRMGTGGGNVPLVMESQSNFIDVEIEVAVRKYDVNKNLLKECLRDHKGNFTNKEISDALGKPLTLVEHWFRRDDSFAIPDADIWFKLKELLGIETTEFDQSITEVEFKGGNYDMRNRIHIGKTTPTLTCGSGNNLYLLEQPEAVCYKAKPHYIVRRLTPLECERLQGYPDGWTDIGEWTDSKGKKKQSSDAARYKALGNSIALPPWKWVLKRLCACYERDATMASLFDGIGGFPYLWEQLNGKGTCLWASEIEEFPIAVTKARIGGDD